jgi:hypothetical protein
MDTKLIGKTDKCNPFAINILNGSKDTPPSAYTGQQSHNDEDIDTIPIRELQWFTNQISCLVFVTSPSYNGLVEIHDHVQAKQLYNNQADGYKFLSLTEKSHQILSDDSANQSGYEEPEIDKVYLLRLYDNYKLQESRIVQYAGLSDNKKWYIFNYVNGPNSDGNSCHLLKVGYFPRYQDSSNPQAVKIEHYTPLT